MSGTLTGKITSNQYSQLGGIVQQMRVAYQGGDYQAALSLAAGYYQAQFTSRGYAEMAWEVVKDVGDGHVANVNVRNAVGEAQYTSAFRTTIVTKLIEEDWRIMNEKTVNADGSRIVNTVADSAVAHMNVFNALSIPIVNWGATPYVAMGTSFLRNSSPAETAEITPSTFKVSQGQVLTSINNLTAAGVQAAFIDSTFRGDRSYYTGSMISDLSRVFTGFLTIRGIESLYNVKYGTTKSFIINQNGDGSIDIAVSKQVGLWSGEFNGHIAPNLNDFVVNMKAASSGENDSIKIEGAIDGSKSIAETVVLMGAPYGIGVNGAFEVTKSGASYSFQDKNGNIAKYSTATDSIISIALEGVSYVEGDGDYIVMLTDGATALTGNGQNLVILAGTNNTLTTAGAQTQVVGLGTGEQVTGSNLIIEARAGASMSVAGSNDTFSLQSGAALGLLGGAGHFVTATGATITTLGATELAVVGSNDTIGLGGGGNTLSLLGGNGYRVSGSKSTINTLANTQFNLAGADDNVNLGKNSTLSLLGGAGYLISASDSTITTTGNTTLNVSGGNDNIGLGGTGNTLGLLGGTGYLVSGTKSAISTLANTQFNLSGSDDNIALGAGSALGLFGGSGFLISATGATITTTGNTSLNVSGGNDSIGLGGTGNTLGLLGGLGYVVSANQSTINTLANTEVSVSGGGDSIGMGSGSALALLAGTGFLVGASNSSIAAAANVGLMVAGDYDAIAMGTGVTLTLASGTGDTIQGSHDTIILAANNQSVTIKGDGDVITGLGTGDALALTGDSNAVNLSAGTISLANGAVIRLSGTNDKVSADAGASAEYIRNNSDGTSTIVQFRPADLPNEQQRTLVMSALDGTGSILMSIDDFVSGVSSVTTYSGTTTQTTDYSGVGGTGSVMGSTFFSGIDFTSFDPINQPIYLSNTEVGFTYGNGYVSTIESFAGSTAPNYFGTSTFQDLYYLPLTTTPTTPTAYDPVAFTFGPSSIYSTANESLFGATSMSPFNIDFASTIDTSVDASMWLAFTDPLVLNMTGGTVATTSLAQSGVVFDMRGNGNREATGWITPGEAFLVVDKQQTGKVTSSNQMFRSTSALAAYDTDKSGKINAADAGYSTLRLWTPGAGGSQGTLQTLAQAGVAELNLLSTAVHQLNNGNEIVSTFDFRFASGALGHGADVAFATGPDLIRNFVVMPGQGTQSFTNTSGLAVPAGELRFGGGIGANNLWLKQIGSDLELDLLGTRNKTTVKNWFGANPGARFAEVKVGGGLEIDSQVGALVSAMATYSAAHPGFDASKTSTMPADTALQSAITAAWHHY